MIQKKSYSRAERLGPLLRAVISEALQRDVKDPRVRGAVVTGVTVSPDLGNARVSWYPMEGAKPDEVAVGLASVAGFLRGHLADQLALRYCPKLRFVMDRGVDQGRRVDEILLELHDHERAQPAKQPDAQRAKQPDAQPAKQPDVQPDVQPAGEDGEDE